MDIIKIDCEKIENKENFHKIMKKELKFSDYYGGNLDALWDELTMIAEPTKIVLENHRALKANLGASGKLILKTLEEAEKENKELKIRLR
ncbi:MAG: barstar family protein [Eubacteriaceae bacterium]